MDGASEVQILEVIDHHKLGNIPSEQPILFINRPVGSTCSIIADLFRSQQIDLNPSLQQAFSCQALFQILYSLIARPVPL